MTMSSTSITSRDPKGRQAVSIFEAAYNRANLDDASVQRINERGGELKSGIVKLLAELSVSDSYVREEVSSRFVAYSPQYQGSKPIEEQVMIVAEIFGLDPAPALEYVANLPPLPADAEGWFAIPSVSALARIHFPKITAAGEQYCQSVNLVLRKIAVDHTFTNYCEGFIDQGHLRVHARTQQALEVIESWQQDSDILMVPAQLGMKHRGRSVHRARERFMGNEFGLTSLAVGSILLTHPSRLGQWDELDMDCLGDEFDDPASNVRFDETPIFHFVLGKIGFNTRWFDYDAVGRCGSVSGFLPH